MKDFTPSAHVCVCRRACVYAFVRHCVGGAVGAEKFKFVKFLFEGPKSVQCIRIGRKNISELRKT